MVATHEAEESGELEESAYMVKILQVGVLTVFFFARSPEAPKTTMTVLSLSSIVLCMHAYQLHFSGGSAIAGARAVEGHRRVRSACPLQP